MNIKKCISMNNALILLVLITIVAVLSIVSGFRDYSIGMDTYNYMSIFLDYKGSLLDAKHEYGFMFLSKLIFYMGGSVEFFFTVVAFVITIFMFFAFLRLSNIHSRSNLILSSSFFFITICLSDWYFSGVTNGLRHAAALSIMYYSLTFLKENRLSYFVAFFVLSVAFHKSVVLLLPFFILFLLSLNFIVLLFLLLQLVTFLVLMNMLLSYFRSSQGLGCTRGFPHSY